MRIRPLTPADFQTLWRFSYSPLIKERDTIYLLLSQDHPRFSFLAIDERDQPRGALLALVSADGRSIFVIALWVDPAYRGRGIGGGLLERFETAARESGVRRVWLLSTREAVDFYRRRGYRQRTDFLHPEAAAYVEQVKRTPVLVKDLEL